MAGGGPGAGDRHPNVNVRESPHHTAGPAQSSVGTQIQSSAVAFIVWGSIYSSRNSLGIYCEQWNGISGMDQRRELAGVSQMIW